ncbi:MAG: hypothetical protein GX783_13785 [Clostridiales bacterium]|nr:hypothetical protein [Clostridiales bacterium]
MAYEDYEVNEENEDEEDYDVDEDEEDYDVDEDDEDYDVDDEDEDDEDEDEDDDDNGDFDIDYKKYEQKCDEIRGRNEAYLDEFSNDLLDSGLKEKTVNSHWLNVNFYINSYLLREEPLEMVHGTHFYKISDFLGNFFIRKCMWSTPGTIKSTAASIKKFYKSMLKFGYIDKSDYEELVQTIKENMDSWMEDCRVYNDPNSDNPFYFF